MRIRILKLQALNFINISFQYKTTSIPVSVQISNSFDLDDARRSYFSSLFPLNPGGIVPVGPTLADLNLSREAGRGTQDFEAVFHMKRQPAVLSAA